MQNNWGLDFKGGINHMHSGKTSWTLHLRENELLHCIILTFLENDYMRPEVNSNQFEISNHFERSFHLHDSYTWVNLKISNHSQKLFCLHGDLTAATFQTIVICYWTCANDSF